MEVVETVPTEETTQRSTNEPTIPLIVVPKTLNTVQLVVVPEQAIPVTFVPAMVCTALSTTVTKPLIPVTLAPPDKLCTVHATIWSAVKQASDTAATLMSRATHRRIW